MIGSWVLFSLVGHCVGDQDVVSRVLDGRHWIDAREQDVAALDRGMHRLTAIEPTRLRGAVRDYMTFYVDKQKRVHKLVTKNVIYRRAVDIAVLNALLLDPNLPTDRYVGYGNAKEFVNGGPWRWEESRWQLIAASVSAYDRHETLTTATVLGVFDVAVRVHSRFAEDKASIARLVQSGKFSSNLGSVRLALVKPQEPLLRSKGLILRITATNTSESAMLLPVNLQPGVVLTLKIDDSLPKSNTISDFGAFPEALVSVGMLDSRTYLVPFEQRVVMTEALPGDYKVEITVSTLNDEMWWRPEPYALFRQFQANLSLRVRVPATGDSYEVVELGASPAPGH